MKSIDPPNPEIQERRKNLFRTFVIYAIFLIVSVSVVVRIIYLQTAKASNLEEKQQKLAFRVVDKKAMRGNILARNGDLLATTIPMYEIRMDTYCMSGNKEKDTALLSDNYFNDRVDSLARDLFKIFGDRSAKEYRNLIATGRKNKDRYLLIKRNVSYWDMIAMKKFAIFKEPKRRGGFISIEQSKRAMPSGTLAKRTIGYQIDSFYVGIEGGFDKYLSGKNGQTMEQKISDNVWIPIEDTINQEPQNGNDVVTTIDIDIQYVANNSLHEAMTHSQAESGCVVVMEVATGDILAIANLTKQKDGSYRESYNTAIGYSYEPGSTFKAVSFMVALEDKKISLTDIYHTGNGILFVPGRSKPIEDSEPIAGGNPTVAEIFAHSSNVGTFKIITENYKNNPQEFINGIYKIGLQNALGLPIQGEGIPTIRGTESANWSKTSLGSMSFGYEVMLTPLQTLTFYNAIANNGVMVKPRFAKSLLKDGLIVESFDTEIINPKICSDTTLKQMQALLRAVVTQGTGRKRFAGALYNASGKTGTAKIASQGGYEDGAYNATFCGYFPTESPKYSCIVLIHRPFGNEFYASQVAIPVFRDIADKIYATDVELMLNAQEEITDITSFLPAQVCSNKNNLQTIFNYIKIDIQFNAKADWVSVKVDEGDILVTEETITKNIVPNVQGMSASDAVFLLEKNGLQTKISGFGVVKTQSISPGSFIKKGDIIYLSLEEKY